MLYYCLLICALLRMPQYINLWKDIRLLNDMAMCSWFCTVTLVIFNVLLIWINNRTMTAEHCHEAIVNGIDETVYYNVPFEGWHPLRRKQAVGMFIVPVFAFLGMLRRKTYDDSF